MSFDQFQASAVVSNRAKKQRETNKLRRQNQHFRNEGNRPEDKRLLTRTDLDVHAYRYVCRATMLTYASIVRFFCEFCEDVLKLPEGTGQQYFKPSGLRPNTKMLRQFLFYLADGGQGRGPDGRITRRTAIGHAQAFFGAYACYNRKTEKEIRDQVMLWVSYNLTDELRLNKGLAITKPVAHRCDVTMILRALFSPLGLRQVLSMRVVLNMSIFINLMVDTCGRKHEIVSSEKYPELYLRWRDLRVFVFKTNDNIHLSANLRLNNLKGLKDQPEEYKEICLTLLPPALCFEDSLRLLLYAALIDGHIKGARNWEELETLMSYCDTDTGILLPFHESSLDLPLIPSIHHVSARVTVDVLKR